MVAMRVSVRLDEEGRRGWDHLSKRHGLPLSVLLEALGRMIDERKVELPAEVVALANAIDFERRSRR